MKFEKGKTYFTWSFFDRDLSIPKVETLIFIGTEREVFGDAEGREGFLCFQDAESFCEGNAYLQAENECDVAGEVEVYSESDRSIDFVVDAKTLLEKLREYVIADEALPHRGK